MQKQEIELRPGYVLTVYGVRNAVNISQRMEQGYFVKAAGVPVALFLLPADVRQDVADVLTYIFPEHAKL